MDKRRLAAKINKQLCDDMSHILNSKSKKKIRVFFVKQYTAKTWLFIPSIGKIECTGNGFAIGLWWFNYIIAFVLSKSK